MLLVLQAGEESGLAEAVNLDEFHLRQELPGTPDQFGSHWRSAIREDLKAPQIVLPGARELSQQIDHGWNQDSVANALALHGLAEALRTKFRQRHLERAES